MTKFVLIVYTLFWSQVVNVPFDTKEECEAAVEKSGFAEWLYHYDCLKFTVKPKPAAPQATPEKK